MSSNKYITLQLNYTNKETELPESYLVKVKIYPKNYILADIQENDENAIFIFGDNLLKVGHGGQAVIRDSLKAFGIPTKKSPAEFFRDEESEENRIAIRKSIEEIFIHCIKNKIDIIYFPFTGIGNGLAKMKEECPITHVFLNQELFHLLGIINEAVPPSKLIALALNANEDDPVYQIDIN